MIQSETWVGGPKVGHLGVDSPCTGMEQTGLVAVRLCSMKERYILPDHLNTLLHLSSLIGMGPQVIYVESETPTTVQLCSAAAWFADWLVALRLAACT